MKPDIAKKLLCLALAACCAAFTACGGNGNDTDGDHSAENAESVVVKDGSEWLAELDDAGGIYNGKEFKVVSVAEALFYNAQENPLARAITYRNSLLQERFDISISCSEKTAEQIQKELEVAYDNGEAYADLICAPVSVLASLAADGLLENVYSLPYLDLSADYADKAGLDSQTVKNTAYMYSGELTHDINAGVGIFYNKALLDSVGVNPVQLARSGSLTWGALSTMLQEVSRKDVYAIDSLLSEQELAMAIYGSSGEGFVSAGGGQAATSIYNATAAENTASILKSVFKNPRYSAGYDESSAVNAFKTGTLAFVVATMDSVSLFDGSKSEWGLLPLPKHSAEQAEYSSFTTDRALAVAVPRGCKDSGFSGFVLNALLAASANALEQALKSTYINYHFWSNDAAVMLNVIGRTQKMDIGVMYAAEQAVANVGAAALLKENNTKIDDKALSDFNKLTSTLFY